MSLLLLSLRNTGDTVIQGVYSQRDQPNFHRRRNGAEFAMAELPMNEFDRGVASGQELHDRAPVLTFGTNIMNSLEHLAQNGERARFWR